MSDEEQQPQETQQEVATVTVISQPQGGGSIIQNGATPWSSGVCGCCSDVKACCLGYFCMPCMLCKIAKGTGDHMCTGFVPGGIVGLRTKVRLSYGLEGDVCKDALISHCCGPLSVCQVQRELQHHGVEC